MSIESYPYNKLIPKYLWVHLFNLFRRLAHIQCGRNWTFLVADLQPESLSTEVFLCDPDGLH